MIFASARRCCWAMNAWRGCKMRAWRCSAWAAWAARAPEALCRAGVGRLTLVDNDTVSLSNINRQIVALHSTVGQPKTAALRARLLDINPACDIEEKNLFFDQSTADGIDFSAFDYVIDAIDTVSAKLLLVERARAAGTPILCCMGTGNKLEPTRLRISAIEKTSVCPLVPRDAARAARPRHCRRARAVVG